MNGRAVAAGAALVAALASTAAAAPGADVTIAARPTIPRWGTPITLSGSVASGKADELVTIQAKECGLPGAFFRSVGAVRTGEGGAWSTPWYTRTTTAFRATWGNATSANVKVQARAGVQLSHLSGNRFEAAVGALVSFRGKAVLIQRFARRVGAWVDVKSVVLGDSDAGGSFVWSSAKFRTVVPKRTLIRAVLPRSQTGPCYLAGYSNLVRT